MKPRIGLAVRTEHPSPPITVGRPELSVATLDDLVIDGPMEERGTTAVHRAGRSWSSA